MTLEEATKFYELTANYLCSPTCESCQADRIAYECILKEIARTDKKETRITTPNGTECKFEGKCDNDCQKCWVSKVIDRLTKYEDADEQGRIITLPVSCGEPVWKIVPPCDLAYGGMCTYDENHQDGEDSCDRKICSAHIEESKFWAHLGGDVPDIGKTVFLTEEEAKKALERIEAKVNE